MASAVDVLTNGIPLIHVRETPTPSDLGRPNWDVPSCLVGAALAAEIDNIDHDVCDAGDEDSFFVADLAEVVTSYRLWQQHLPNVHAHYAVKCNTDRKVIQLLGSMGANFDCALKNEIDTVIGMGFDASRIVYANPCKTNSFIRHARANNVNLTTVDNTHELVKLAKFHPRCKVLLRIATEDETAQCPLLTKFGCSVASAIGDLLPKCKEVGLKPVGVAFHVGSGAKNFDLIFKAIRDSRVIFDAAESMGFAMRVLDIGGGFERDTFAKAAEVVNMTLAKFFPADFCEPRRVRFIAEPGRFMVAEAFTLATHIIARRDVRDEALDAMLYINDGVYGNLNCILFDHQHPTPKVLKCGGQVFADTEPTSEHEHVYSLWGPTCDSLDCVTLRVELRANLQVGDWLYFPAVGAYTSAATTAFNGFSGQAVVKYVMLSSE